MTRRAVHTDRMTRLCRWVKCCSLPFRKATSRLTCSRCKNEFAYFMTHYLMWILTNLFLISFFCPSPIDILDYFRFCLLFWIVPNFSLLFCRSCFLNTPFFNVSLTTPFLCITRSQIYLNRLSLWQAPEAGEGQRGLLTRARVKILSHVHYIDFVSYVLQIVSYRLCQGIRVLC